MSKKKKATPVVAEVTVNGTAYTPEPTPEQAVEELKANPELDNKLEDEAQAEAAEPVVTEPCTDITCPHEGYDHSHPAPAPEVDEVDELEILRERVSIIEADLRNQSGRIANLELENEFLKQRLDDHNLRSSHKI